MTIEDEGPHSGTLLTLFWHYCNTIAAGHDFTSLALVHLLPLDYKRRSREEVGANNNTRKNSKK
jgi:hypothetical protein